MINKRLFWLTALMVILPSLFLHVAVHQSLHPPRQRKLPQKKLKLRQKRPRLPQRKLQQKKPQPR